MTLGDFSWGKFNVTTPSADHVEHWSTVCEGISVSGQLGTVLGSVLENPDVIHLKVHNPVHRPASHLLYCSLGPTQSIYQTVS